jgi:hypothetical protein
MESDKHAAASEHEIDGADKYGKGKRIHVLQK